MNPEPALPAIYWGTCEACDGEIKPGMEVERVERVGLVHQECVQ